MKARLGVEDLRTALSTVKPAVRPAAPFVILDTEVAEGLMVAADNWDVQIRTQVPAWSPVKGKGRVAVPHRPLAELASRLSGVEVEMSPLDEVLEVRAGGTDMRLPLAHFDLPNRIEPEGETHVFDVVDWEAIWQVATHASTEEGRPALHGIFFEPDAVACTDSYRLAVYKVDTGMTSNVPADMIPRVTDEELDVVTMTADDRAVKITVGPTTSWAAPIAADPPRWRSLLDDSKMDEVTFDAEAMVDVIGRVAIAGRQLEASGKALIIRPVEEGSILICSDSDPDDPNGRVEEIMDITGDLPWPVALNSRYIADAIKVIGTDKVTLRLKNPSSPIYFEHADFTIVLMTMRVTA